MNTASEPSTSSSVSKKRAVTRRQLFTEPSTSAPVIKKGKKHPSSTDTASEASTCSSVSKKEVKYPSSTDTASEPEELGTMEFFQIAHWK